MHQLNLQFLCIEALAVNLDGFYKQYLSGIVPATEICLGLFTHELVKQYNRVQGKKVNAYLHFLINRYLKTFNYKYFDGFNVDNLCQRIDIWGENVTHLNLSSANFNEESPVIKRITSSTPNVKTLIMQTCCRDVHLQYFACLHQLEYLNICGSRKITQKGIENLCLRNGSLVENSTLKYLNIINTNTNIGVLNFCFKFFPGLCTLKHNKMADVLFEICKSKDAIESSERFKLRQLPLDNLHLKIDFHREIYEWLLCYPFCNLVESLEIIHFDHNKLLHNMEFPRMKNLSIKGDAVNFNIVDIDGLLIDYGLRLVSLKLNFAKVSVNFLSELCPLLKEVVLVNTEFKSCDLNSKHIFAHLKRIVVVGAKFENSPDGIVAISYMLSCSPNLEEFCAQMVSGFAVKTYFSILEKSASVEDILLLRAADVLSLTLNSVHCTPKVLATFLSRAIGLEFIKLHTIRGSNVTSREFSVIEKALTMKRKKCLIVEYVS